LRTAAKRDANEAEIVAALERFGFSVERVSSPGIPDLLMSRRSRWYVAEVKSKSGKPTDAQNRVLDRAQAHIPLLRNVEDVVAWATLVD